MSPELPEIDVDQIAEMDIKQAYYLLFQLIKDDFVTKQDFDLHVGTMTALPSQSFKVTDAMAGVYPLGEVLAAIYKLLAETGGAVKEGLISAAEQIIE